MSSLRIWAASYVNASLDAMTDLVKRELTMSPSSLISCSAHESAQKSPAKATRNEPR